MRTLSLVSSSSPEHLAYAQSDLKRMQAALVGEIFDIPSEDTENKVTVEDTSALKAKKGFLEYITATEKGFSSLDDILATYSKVDIAVNS